MHLPESPEKRENGPHVVGEMAGLLSWKAQG